MSEKITIVTGLGSASFTVSTGARGPIGPQGSTDWDDLQNVPETFSPSAHTHSLADVTDAGDSASLDVGTTAGTVAAGDHTHPTLYLPLGDASVTNSREWTAATVDQSEAETGSATTRRAWTALRVRQAIAAWWTTVSSTKADASHTHAVTDLDIAGGTEIGGALADGDLIPLRDISGTPANKTTAVSRIIDLMISTGRTLAGSWAFSSTTRPTSAGTGTPSSNSLITLSDCQAFAIDSLNILNFQAIPGSALASGSGAVSATPGTMQGAWVLSAGTTASGYAKVSMAENWHSFNEEGSIGWNFSKPFIVSGTFFMSNGSTTAEGLHRFYLGNGTANNANSNMFTDDGIGIEIATSKGGGANTYARLTWHDGSSYQTGTWVQIASGLISNARPVSYKISNNGTGGISFWIKAAASARVGPPSLLVLPADYTTLAGPTGTTPQFTCGIYWASENDSSAYTSGLGSIYVNPLRFIHL